MRDFYLSNERMGTKIKERSKGNRDERKETARKEKGREKSHQDTE